MHLFYRTRKISLLNLSTCNAVTQSMKNNTIDSCGEDVENFHHGKVQIFTLTFCNKVLKKKSLVVFMKSIRYRDYPSVCF